MEGGKDLRQEGVTQRGWQGVSRAPPGYRVQGCSQASSREEKGHQGTPRLGDTVSPGLLRIGNGRWF